MCVIYRVRAYMICDSGFSEEGGGWVDGNRRLKGDSALSVPLREEERGRVGGVFLIRMCWSAAAFS